MKDCILHEKGVLPKEMCEDIIHKFEFDWVGFQQVGSMAPDFRVDPTKEASTEIFWDLDQMDPPFDLGYLGECVSKYKEFFPILNDGVARWKICSTIKIQRYYPEEGYFLTHCENDGNCNGFSEKRMLVWMIYLNDVTDGGETEFPTQNIKFQPRAGDILIWPAYFTHPHHGITSRTQTKYILTGWYIFE